MSRTVLIGGIFHETHSFVDDTTPLGDFQIRLGDALLACAGDASPLGGVLEHTASRDWQLHPTLDIRTTPSGTVEDDVLEFWWGEFQNRWNPDCDAIYLVLHGAMVCQSTPDVEGELLARIRTLPGASGKPIFGVYDLHANFSPEMARAADCLIGYRENPHTDARDSAVRAAQWLEHHWQTGQLPTIEHRSLPIIWPPTGTGTAEDPMRALEARARELETDPAIWALNITAGFAYADTPHTGVSLQAITSGNAAAALNELEQLALERKAKGEAIDTPIEAVMPAIRDRVNGLTVLVEPSDNIGGGAPGDCTGCLRALIDHQIEEAAVCLNDPEAVAALSDCRPGQKNTLSLGGKGSKLDHGPLTLKVKFISRSDGRFELENKQSHLASMVGDYCEMGPCAVVRHGGLTLLLTSIRTAPFDLGQWHSQGVAVEKLNVVVVKAAVAHRAAYDPITARSFTVDTPGPCSSNLKRLPYKHFRGSA